MQARLAVLLFALLSAGAGAADIVTMKSGDRLSGTIVSLDSGVLTLETSYAGKIPIKWPEVAGIETATPAKFKLRDGTVLQAQALRGAGSTVVLKSGEVLTTAPIALADVAYINPPPEVTGEGVSVSGRANLGFTANRGNTDNTQLYYEVEAITRGATNRFTIGALGEQKEEDGEETAKRNRAWLKYDHFFSEKWYGYANGDFEEDQYKDLNLRSTLGVGAGYQFRESEQTNLSLEGGLSYVNDDFDLAEDNNYPAGRWAVRFDRFLFGTTTQFFHIHEGLVSLEDAADTTIRAQTGFRFPLIEQLTATLQYNVDWRNEPAPGTDGTDSSYIVSMGYLW